VPQNGRRALLEVFVARICAGETLAEGARACGITARTALRWRKLPAYKKLFEDQKNQLVAAMTTKLRVESAGAIDTLASIHKDPTAPRTARVNAARAIAELALAAHHEESHEDRLDKVEEALGYGDQGF